MESQPLSQPVTASATRTIKLTIAYDGTNYAGWQFQIGQTTLQAVLEDKLAKITGQFRRVTASGRTDAGVHALGQVVSFQTYTHLSAEILQRALNAELPRDILVLKAEEAPLDFHAIRQAKRKRYRYVINDGELPNVFERHYAWQIFGKLNVPAMHEAAQAFVGTHDFASFETSGSERKSTIRTVYECFVRRPGQGSPTDRPIHRWSSPSEQRIELEIEANGFLYNMVRTIVGTLVEVGRGRKPIEWPARVIAAVDRRAAGQTAPPQGLFLVEVKYEE